MERIRLTHDGIILPRNYSYWQWINAHRGHDSLVVLLGTSEGPYTWSVDKQSGDVTPMGPLFTGSPLQNGTAEGWYFSPTDPHVLYCSDDKHLYTYDMESRELDTVVDITPFQWLGDFAARQWHSSHDGKTHSCSILHVVPDGAWPKLGTLVYTECKWKYFKAKGALDEAQIDKSGRYLLIKEDNDQRVIDLTDDFERTLTDQEGAVGHSDNGFGYAVGADNWQQLAAWRLHDFETGTSHIIYETSWDEQVLHVSHCNAMNLGATTQWVLGSGTVPALMKIYLDGVPPAEEICPMRSVDLGNYDNLPKASLDPYGTWALWIEFDGQRHDAFLVNVV
jgi:hypothetical protein